jgi:hypothetical protein
MGSYVRATGVTLVAGSAALAASLWLAARQEV